MFVPALVRQLLNIPRLRGLMDLDLEWAAVMQRDTSGKYRETVTLDGRRVSHCAIDHEPEDTCRLGRGREHPTPVPTWSSVGHGDNRDHASSRAFERRVDGEIITTTGLDRKSRASHSSAGPNRTQEAGGDGGSGFSHGRRAQFP